MSTRALIDRNKKGRALTREFQRMSFRTGFKHAGKHLVAVYDKRGELTVVAKRNKVSQAPYQPAWNNGKSTRMQHHG